VPKIIGSTSPLFASLREAGIADENTRRVVIDIRGDAVPIVHIERYGDSELINVIRTLAGVEINRRDASDG
jgi:hypothetical protein